MTDKDKTQMGKSLPKCEFDSKKLILHLNLAIPANIKHIDPVVEKIMWVVDQMRCAVGNACVADADDPTFSVRRLYRPW